MTRWRVRFCHLALVLVAGLATRDLVLAQEPASGDNPVGPFADFDPLRRYLPRGDLFMQVPGGKIAIEASAGNGSLTIEEQISQRHGGLVVGYCLKASCSRVTHLAVLQVCSGQVGGPDGAHSLVLGVVRLPFGRTPGYVRSLQGRNYIHNFKIHGPHEQLLFDNTGEGVNANYSLWAEGTGEVAPLEYTGLEIKDVQSVEAIAVRMTTVRDAASGIRFPRFDVRHLCKPQLG